MRLIASLILVGIFSCTTNGNQTAPTSIQRDVPESGTLPVASKDAASPTVIGADPPLFDATCQGSDAGDDYIILDIPGQTQQELLDLEYKVDLFWTPSDHPEFNATRSGYRVRDGAILIYCPRNARVRVVK